MPTKISSFSGQYSFLSNFYWFKEDGKFATTTVEHLYQAAKTIDRFERAAILTAPSSYKAKVLGRSATLVPDWDKDKVEVMRQLVRYKFKCDVEIRYKLIETGEAELIEGNTWGDDFWGVAMSSGRGLNWLGKILMEVREEAKQGRLK